MKKDTIPKNILARVEAELQSGEKLLWVGKPSVERMLRQAVPETAQWLSFMIGIELATFLALLFGTGGRATPWIYGIAILILMLSTVAADLFSRYWRAQQTIYAISNQRAIIIEGEKVSSFGEGSLQNLERHKSDVIFKTELRERMIAGYGIRNQSKIETGFLGVEAPEQVELLLMETFMNKDTASKRLMLEAVEDIDVSHDETQEQVNLEQYD